MINNRQSFRLRQQFDVTWSIPDQMIEGEGIIFNISLTGMLFVTDGLFKPDHELIMYFKVAQAPAFPAKGKLIRFRKVGNKEMQYQCGVQFINDITKATAWAKWMEDNIFKLADTEDSRVLDRFLNEGQDS